MRFLYLTLLYGVFQVFSPDQVWQNPVSVHTSISKSSVTNATASNDAVATNIIYQSKDGGQTWQDVSNTLPENQLPDNFFAGESELYLRVNDVMYRSKNNLKTPVWEKDGLVPSDVSIAFNRSGVYAYNYDGLIYQKSITVGSWTPIYTDFQNRTMRTIFETADGTVFQGSDNGLHKSSDGGKNWSRVQHEGWVMHMVESEGVLMATGQKGIMRSTDNGENWEWVIREGGVGTAIERIDGGFAAISCNTTTMSRRIHVSLDKGKTWKSIDEGLRPSLFISSIKQVGEYLLCGHPDGIFRSSDMGKTWNRVHSGVDKNEVTFDHILPRDPFKDHTNVFNIFVSGDIVYAVAKSAGC